MMPAVTTYRSIYPSEPLLRATDYLVPRAADVLNLEYFEADPATMPTGVFSQHHILLNLRDTPQRIENFRKGRHRDFMFRLHEVVITPAGVESGWRWHERSRCIVVTIDPHLLGKFAEADVGAALEPAQLADEPQVMDRDLTAAAISLRDALASRHPGYEVVYESMARAFLIRLLRDYGRFQGAALGGRGDLVAEQYDAVLDYVRLNYRRAITTDDLAGIAGVSAGHFSKLFKRTFGTTPHRFLMMFRIERAQEKLADEALSLADIADDCGFSDQAHFSRAFSKAKGMPPSVYRKLMRTRMLPD